MSGHRQVVSHYHSYTASSAAAGAPFSQGAQNLINKTMFLKVGVARRKKNNGLFGGFGRMWEELLTDAFFL